VVPFLPPLPLQHTSDQDPVNQCMTIQNLTPSAIHSFQLLNRTTAFLLFFKGTGIKDGWYMRVHIVTENVILG
jgi:hypothetical protein